jgi:purine-cytosine permease-like protein
VISVKVDPLVSDTASLSWARGVILTLVVTVVAKVTGLLGRSLGLSTRTRDHGFAGKSASGYTVLVLLILLAVGLVGVGRNLCGRLLCLVCVYVRQELEIRPG